MKTVYRIERTSHRSKFYQVTRTLADDDSHEVSRSEVISRRPLSHDEAVTFREKCEKYHLHKYCALQ